MPTSRIADIIEELRSFGEPFCNEAAQILEIGLPTAYLHVDINKNTAERADKRLRLSPNEAVLLQALHAHIGHTTSIELLHREVYGARAPLNKQNIRAHIPSLRRKVRQLGGEIITRLNDGYKLELHPLQKKKI